MKKISIFLIASTASALVIIPLLFTGCKKEAEFRPITPNIVQSALRSDSTECIGPVNIDGHLAFCDEVSFTNFMQNLDSTLEGNNGDLSAFYSTYNINSWRTQYLQGLNEYCRDTISELPIDSKALGAVMNINGILQVGKWIFKVNPDTKMVYVLDENYQDEIQSLNEPVPTAIHVRVFDFQTDVFDILEFNSNAKMAKVSGESCANNDHEKDKNKNFCGSQDYKFKLRYYSYGIWRELVTKYKTNVREELRVYDFGYDVFWKQKNKSSAQRNHNISFNGNTLANYFTKGDTKITFYSNTRCLSSYKMDVKVAYYDQCQTQNTVFPLFMPYYSATEILKIN